jgi:hypothetical protein
MLWKCTFVCFIYVPGHSVDDINLENEKQTFMQICRKEEKFLQYNFQRYTYIYNTDNTNVVLPV